MADTIPTRFNTDDLPEWAQRNRDVRWLAARDLRFRVNICAAQTTLLRQALAQRATNLRQAVENR